MIAARLDAVPPPAFASRSAASGTGFSVPAAAAPARTAPTATATIRPSGSLAASLLSFQEHADGNREDDEARARAESLLVALRAVQHALLGIGGAPDPAAVERLRLLAEADAGGRDPLLRAAVRSVVLRARVALLGLDRAERAAFPSARPRG